MRMIPIDIVVEITVCARDHAEAVEAARRGMREGRYADDAKYYFAASRVKKGGEA